MQSKFDGKLVYDGVKFLEVPEEDGSRIIVIGRSGVVNVLDHDNRMLTKYDVPYGATMRVSDGARVARGEIIYEWDPYNAVIISEHAGVVKYHDLRENVTYREIDDEQTGHIQRVVIDSRDRSLAPGLGSRRPHGVVRTRRARPRRAARHRDARGCDT